MSRARDIANLQSSKITADAGIDIDNINIDGTEIDLSSGDLTIDVAGDIHLDADGGDINFKDGGTTFGFMAKSNDNLLLGNLISDGDVLIRGNDADGGNFTALSFDMSDQGTATFNHDVKMGDLCYLLLGAGNDLELVGDGTNGKIAAANGTLTLDVAGDIHLDAGGSDIRLEVAGTQFGKFTRSSGDFIISSSENDKDMKFAGADGGADITALTLDMSEAGQATFNSTVIAPTMTLSRSSSNSPNVEPVLLFDNIDSAIGANENIGSIRFTTSAEGSGSDALLESGRIACFSESGHGSTLNASSLAFYTASSEAASERMRITSAGQLSVGLAGTPDSHIKILSAGTNATNFIGLRNTSASDGSGTRYSYINYEGTQSGGEISTLAQIGAEHQGTADDEKGNLVFTTNDGNDGDSPNERMRIGNHGKITSTTIVDDWNLQLNNGNSSAPYGQFISFTAAAPDNNTSQFLNCSDTSTSRLIIYSDGDVVNHDNSYGSTSDERIKQDIVDANSQWDDIKAVRVRNYKKKDDVAQYGDKAGSQIGVIAQELEAVSPKLIKEASPTASDIKHSADFGTLYEDGDTIPDGKEVGDIKETKENVKRVNYSVLYMKAIKALQEAMTRIETLEAKVKTLEGE